MILDILSLILYIATIIYGVVIGVDQNRSKRKQNLYFLWLYIFLCFGYMTGSDWRAYEIDYTEGLNSWQYITEPLSWVVISYAPKFISDFWLFLGISKCCYLASTIYVYKRITAFPVASIACAVEMFLIFMLVDNPLRYMFSLIPVNIAIVKGYQFIQGENRKKKNIIEIFALILIGALFHNSCLVFFLLFPLLYIFRDISKYNRSFIFVAFIILFIVTSSPELINSVKNFITSIFASSIDGRTYEGYDAQSAVSAFSFGNVLKILFLLLVLVTRNKVISSFDNGKIVYSYSVLYFFIDRMTVMIESGYRLVIPLMIFYSIYVGYLLCIKSKIGYFIITYLVLQISLSIWSGFIYAPYSNSIPYILMGHKQYYERYYHNFDAARQRTGKDLYYNAK